MTGGLLQLVSYGVQDTYLTGNPKMTFFKSVYKRHTNFAIESIAQSIKGEFSFEERISVKIDRNGDLINKCYLEITVANESGSLENSYTKAGASLFFSAFIFSILSS